MNRILSTRSGGIIVRSYTQKFCGWPHSPIHQIIAEQPHLWESKKLWSAEGILPLLLSTPSYIIFGNGGRYPHYPVGSPEHAAITSTSFSEMRGWLPTLNPSPLLHHFRKWGQINTPMTIFSLTSFSEMIRYFHINPILLYFTCFQPFWGVNAQRIQWLFLPLIRLFIKRRYEWPIHAILL